MSLYESHVKIHSDEGHMKTESEIEMMQLEDKECQGLPGASEDREKQGMIIL